MKQEKQIGGQICTIDMRGYICVIGTAIIKFETDM